MSTETNSLLETSVSPKRNPIALRGRASWYPYYAGYSPAFVQEALGRVACQPSTVVLDPWNGAGTTSQVASDLGCSVWGFDINPVMAIVASARLLSKHDASRLQAVVPQIVRRAKTFRFKYKADGDPLLDWMDAMGTQAARYLERAVLDCLGCSPLELVGPQASVDSTTAFFYTAIFRTLRAFAGRFRPTNPTWLKVPSRDMRISISAADLAGEFHAIAVTMLAALQEEPNPVSWPRKNDCRIAVGSSKALPLPPSSVDVVITSPPYCTRIDYAVSTRLELAVLRQGTSFRELRNRMIGTSTIRTECPNLNPQWGATCLRLMNAIENHSSRASRSYYFKTHAQYFDDIFCSLGEINKCLRPGGQCVLVVQDSFYKDIHNDLPLIVEEMASVMGWVRTARYDFPVSRTMAGLNTRSKQYTKSRSTTESTLWFSNMKN